MVTFEVVRGSRNGSAQVVVSCTVNVHVMCIARTLEAHDIKWSCTFHVQYNVQYNVQ